MVFTSSLSYRNSGDGRNMTEKPDQILDETAANRDLWTIVNAQFTDADAARAWAQDEIVWGLFDIPEDDIGALGAISGRDIIELGCGSAYFSARLAAHGARPVGVDLTPAQLATARRSRSVSTAISRSSKRARNGCRCRRTRSTLR